MSTNQKKYFLLFFVAIIISNLSAEIQFCISGKVTRNGNGVAGILVRISLAHDFNELKKYFVNGKFDPKLARSNKDISKNTSTDKNGIFTFYLQNGYYEIDCSPNTKVPGTGGDEYIAVGPETVVINSKNVNIEFRLFTKGEVVEGNRAFLNEIPQPNSSVIYKWGRLPLFSESECVEHVRKRVVSLEKSIGIQGILIGTPITFFDLKGNPVFYEYPCFFKQVEIASFGVYAIGIEPECAADNYVMSEITDQYLNEKKGKESLKDYYVSDALEIILKEYNCNKNDIKIDRFICLAYSAPRAMMGKIESKNKVFIITLDDDYSILNDSNVNWLDTLEDYVEREFTFEYIRQKKYILKMPIL